MRDLIEQHPQTAMLHQVRMGVLTCLAQTLSALGRDAEVAECRAEIEQCAQFIRARAQLPGTDELLEASQRLVPSEEQGR